MRKTESERFWEKVDFTGPCWEWTAYRLQGYGRFGVGGRGGRIVYAHRWAWEHLVGPIPDGSIIDHLCRNRACVNPDHLEPVTSRVNSLRGYSHAALNARKTHCPQGHPYSEENTYRMANGNRICRTCSLSYSRRYRRERGAVPWSEKPVPTHCANGHEWTEENTYRNGRRYRACRECTLESQRRYKQRKKDGG